jgi:tRNA modification GTPase
VNTQLPLDTIAAVATPPGNGGVGIIRISGPKVPEIALNFSNIQPVPRQAHYLNFTDVDGSTIDSGILLYFPAPASYTGEHVLELQGHGGAVVLNMLLKRVINLGARIARPGEFTERAFINGKLDLAQAEAVADLIASSTEQSVRSAQKSMQGIFSSQINALVDELIELRVYVEAAIDFVDEEIDFLSDGIVENRIIKLVQALDKILATAEQGRLLRDGMTVVLAGKPNAGKSSLLNALAGHEAAIVTEVAGTTRDVLKERIQIDGMPLHIVDTAGLRDSDNIIEQEGIRRAREEIKKADIILVISDIRDSEDQSLDVILADQKNTVKIINKIDLQGKQPELINKPEGISIYLSAKKDLGLDLLKQVLKQTMGFKDNSEDVFIARTRHIDALTQARLAIQIALEQLQNNQAGELVAEDLRQAQNQLAEITGKVSSDDLLGHIFSSFCIGK